MNLFAYGTLMDRRVMFKVTGRTLPTGVAATLHGYRKYETTLGYPVILPDSGATCQGQVFFGITHPDWQKLDQYENVFDNPPAYTRKLVQVHGTHGTISAFVYVGNLNFFRTRLKN